MDRAGGIGRKRKERKKEIRKEKKEGGKERRRERKKRKRGEKLVGQAWPKRKKGIKDGGSGLG